MLVSVLVALIMPIGDASVSFAQETSEPTPAAQPAPTEPVADQAQPESSPAPSDPAAPVTSEGPVSPADPTAEQVSLNEAPMRLDAGVLAAEPSSFATLAAAAPMNFGPMAVGDGCNYANPNTGAYSSTLCWIDMTGLTTTWVEISSVTETITSTQFAACTPRTGTSGTNYRRTTKVYESSMGGAYGTLTFTGCARNSTAATAVTNSQTQVRNARNAAIHNAGTSTTDTGPFYGSVTNWPIEITLSDSFVFRANLNVTSPTVSGGLALRSVGFPTWSGSFLGNNNFYTGVAGQPALYQDIGGTTTISLTDIQVQNTATSAKVTGFSVVVADAESTDNEESISWSHAGGTGFLWLPNSPGSWSNVGTTTAANTARKTAAVGNACAATPVTQFPQNSNTSAPAATRTCSAGTSQPSPKTGTAMLQISPANTTSTFSVTQSLVGGGLQAVAFGVVLAGARVNVEVADRVLTTGGTPSTAEFSASMSTPGFGAFNASTGTAGLSGTTNDQFFPLSTTGTTTLTFAATSPADPTLSSYRQTWNCEKSTGSDPVREQWSGNGGSAPPVAPWTNLFGGQFIECTVTYTPPYVTLAKTVQNGTTASTNTAADFTLTATGTASIGSALGDAATKLPLRTGSYALSETGPNTNPWVFGYDWSNLQCLANAGSASLPVGAFTKTTNAGTGMVTSGTLALSVGQDLTCTYTNQARQPELLVSKSADVASGTGVNGGDTVTYTLTFDNSGGSSDATVDHVDHLKDVLDDATYNSASIRYGNGTGTPSGLTPLSPGVTATPSGMLTSDPKLTLSGIVPRGAKRTVLFTVTVKPNSSAAADRQSETAPLQGYLLRNYVTKAGDAVPATCQAPSGGAPAMCTEHPVRAWTMSKAGLPASGARLHKGGNVLYRLSATKLNSATSVQNLTFTDDLTQAFQTAGWAPNAAVPGGALPRGIYFFDASNNSLDAAGNITGPSTAPVAAYAGAAGVPAPQFVGGRWLLTSTTVNLPANAMRAELWFALQAGETPAGIPAQWAVQPQSGYKFVNYATGQATLAPNQCSTATTVPPVVALPQAANPVDPLFPSECVTSHELRDNFFTIRKDAAGSGEDLERTALWGTDPTGLWNMVGHEFEIRDNAGGAPTSYSSVKLCRTEYAQASWDGTWISGGTPDWGNNSATLAWIRAWNTLNPLDQKPYCGLIYAQPSGSGGQTGRWRSENLPEGNYWLVETKAPNQQISLNGLQLRAVPGVQILPDPVAFTVWPDADAPPFGNGQSMFGRGQLDVSNGSGGYLDRCEPGGTVGSRPVACVNPTGYLLLVKDAVPLALPFAGGQGMALLTVGGFVALGGAALGAWWWRRRRAPEGAPNPARPHPDAGGGAH